MGAAQGRRGGCGSIILVLVVIAFIVFAQVGGGPGDSSTATNTDNGVVDNVNSDGVGSGDVDSGGAVTRSETQAEEDAFTLINFITDDLQLEFWPEEFAEAGLTYDLATVEVFENDVTTGGCGRATSAVGPFYCPADNTAYIDIEYMFLLQDQLGAQGDFSAAYILAHEIGHHVQNLLGINGALRTLQSTASTVESNGLQVSLELQADCFAGAWASSFDTRFADNPDVGLEAGDLEEGVNAAGAVGDDAITGSTNQENFTHGSSAQRIEWFNIGFNEGTDSCTTFDGSLTPG